VKPAPAFDKISVSQPLALPGQRFVARQPIFDRSQNVYGYEISFAMELRTSSTPIRNWRPGPRWIAPAIRHRYPLRSQACLHELHPGSLIQGSNYLAASRPDRGRDSGERGTEDRVIAACKRLRAAGYRLPWMTSRPTIRAYRWSSLPTSSSRHSRTRPEERVGMMRRLAPRRCKMLAEKVETPHEFQQARDMGFVYFQGYFFRRPKS